MLLVSKTTKMEDFILSATPISSFMPIFMTSDNASFNFSSKNHENEWICVLRPLISTLSARDPKTEDLVSLAMLLLQICNLLLRVNFHDPLTILAATFPPTNHENEWICTLRAQICALRARDPRTEDVILSAMLISCFMPIFMTL